MEASGEIEFIEIGFEEPKDKFHTFISGFSSTILSILFIT